MSRRERLADLELVVHHDTGSAILVSDDGNRSSAKWLPKVLIEMHQTNKSVREFNTGEYAPKDRPIWEITVPQHIAEQKGLV